MEEIIKLTFTTTKNGKFVPKNGGAQIGEGSNLPRTEKDGLVCARKIARKILIQNIWGLMVNMVYLPLYM